MRDIDRLADVVVVYRFFNLLERRPSKHTVSYLNDVEHFEEELRVLVKWARDQDEIARRIGGPFYRSFGGPLYFLTSVEVTVAAAGPDWPDLREVDDETLALPNVFSNVEEGLGFLGGIISKTVFWPGFEPEGE